ncbi:MAG TPA: RidA family protein [Solirubrobacteraceae bacterium]|nr:RidA family protein [Solirubrobacteraceae bacterium]
MTDGPDERLAALGVELPAPPAPAAAYKPWSVAGDLVFTAGQLPLVDGKLLRTGRLGDEVTTAEGADLARAAAINVLAVARAAAGDLRRVRVVKLTVFVASADGYTEQHLVANGASEFVAQVLGDDGLHARSAVGVASLPLGAPVEVEAVLRLGAA